MPVSRRACCAVIVLSACFHPDYDRPRCGSHGECPGHLACIDQVCEEPNAVPLELALPDGPLAPAGVTSADVVVHGPSGDTMRTALVASGAIDLGAIDLGAVDPAVATSVEVTLRAGGAIAGYGRTAVVPGKRPVIAARRPIVYAAGTISAASTGNPADPLHWTQSPATYLDLTNALGFDGSTLVGAQAVLAIAAGPALYLVTQAVTDPSGALTGPAGVVPVSAADHRLGAALAGAVTGWVFDGAGSDDGSVLAIGTATQLFALDTATGAARAVASGSFARVAILTTADGEIDAVAVKNRGSLTDPTCTTTAELWWVPLVGAPAGAVAHKVATGGFSDVATDRGHAYYVDACSRQLGEATAAGVQALQTVPAPGAAASRPSALAVANGQAYVAVTSQPATLALMVLSLASGEPPRMLWTDRVQQALRVTEMPEIQRVLDAGGVNLDRLELGAGGAYVALTSFAHFHGAEVAASGFPDMVIDTEELRVLDTRTGAALARYRSWCDGFFTVTITTDFKSWQCAANAGQTSPAARGLEHHVASLAFLYGQR